MKFKCFTTYGVLDCRGKMVKRPMLELELLDLKGDKVFNSLALVDSGADTTMVNIQYATALGVDLSKANNRDVVGISETAKYRSRWEHLASESREWETMLKCQRGL